MTVLRNIPPQPTYSGLNSTALIPPPTNKLLLSDLPPLEAAGWVRCGSTGRCRWYPTGSDGDGSGPGPDHWPAAGHTSWGHHHPRTRAAAHAGGIAQWASATLPLHPLGLSCHTYIKHRYNT